MGPVVCLSWFGAPAQLDRKSIAIYLRYKRGQPQATLAAIKSIDVAMERVRTLPDSGGRLKIDRLRHTEYRTVLANPYTVYYRFNDTALTIYRVCCTNGKTSTHTRWSI